VFKPEFINRLDEVIVFRHLTMEEILKIVDLMMKRVAQEVASQGRTLEMTSAAREVLGMEGFDPVYGARPLRRAIQRLVEDPLAEHFIRGTFKEGDTVVVDAVNSQIVFHRPGEEPVKHPAEFEERTSDKIEESGKT